MELKNPADRRRERAAIRLAESAGRTPEEQLARLDKAFGVGKGAARERAKLAKKLNQGGKPKASEKPDVAATEALVEKPKKAKKKSE